MTATHVDQVLQQTVATGQTHSFGQVSEHRQRRVGEVEAFLRDHVARRREEEAARRAALAAEAAADAERAEEHLRRVEAARQEEEWSRGAHVNFWTNQKGETEREKKEVRRMWELALCHVRIYLQCM